MYTAGGHFSISRGHSILKFWKNLSIAKKLYFVVGTMAILITGELVTLRFAMHSLSAVRAFVEAEGTWSKAQKDAALSLQRYGATQNEEDYQAFLNYFSVSEGDHLARLELLTPRPNLARVRQGFLQGKVHPDDIDGVVDLLQRYSSVSYLKRAIDEWRDGDQLLAELKSTGETYHRLFHEKNPDKRAINQTLARIRSLNDELTLVEGGFSTALGQGSRWLEQLVISILFMAVLLVETFGLTLTFVTSRMISRGLMNLNEAARKIGEGDFSQRLQVHSQDEIGQLTFSVNKMGEIIQKTYGELEQRVMERTTELAALAAENAKLYEEARAAVHIREEFLSIASHELKTPFTSQYLQLQMLRKLAKGAPESPEVQKIREYSEFVLKVAKKQIELIEELMDLTRLRVGKFEIRPTRCDLAVLASEVVSSLASENGASIQLEASSEILGQFDPVRIAQVITNLVSNALKYGGGSAIEVQVKKLGDAARILVKDEGPGIDPSAQERIFERFERHTSNTSIGGLGLGLYITRQIVESHGGTISVKSRPGEGAEFIVDIPG
jgi:signal transduction histidine kinase